jgi:MoxR-like ATPase
MINPTLANKISATAARRNFGAPDFKETEREIGKWVMLLAKPLMACQPFLLNKFLRQKGRRRSVTVTRISPKECGGHRPPLQIESNILPVGRVSSHRMKSTQEITQEVRELGQWIPPLRQQVGHVVVGQKYLVDRLLLGLLANGHILLEGVPGLAKTLTVKTMAACIQTGFQRLQFTPDLLPADLIGTLIYNPRTGEFTTKLGPIFSNLILADEINRAPAKVQSALLEAMQERQVTIGEQTYPLSDPFLVLATQNPIEQEGTYQLPEAQLDRFMFKLNIGYPQKTEERQILDLMATSAPDLRVDPVVEPKQIIASRDVVNSIYIDDRVKDYIVDVVWATREPASYNLRLEGLIRYGASPRATIYLALGARAHAFLNGRGYVTPQDVKSIGPDVLRHRIIVSYEAEAEAVTSETIIERIFAGLPVP